MYYNMLLLIFSLTLFLSAFLLFWIQPLFGKMVLPLLGGSPGVWNTSMLFFQLALLAGYTYVHILCKHIKITWQPFVHISVLCIAAAVLPVEVSSHPDGTEIPFIWLLGLLASSIGLPYFAVSTSAPLLQRWFSLSTHADAGNPYFLYAASNLGSLAALVCYPVLFEPLFRLTQQGRLWAIGYVLLIVLTTLCVILLRKENTIAGEFQTEMSPAPATWRQRLLWIALSFAPSSLLLGVTAHITTDVAAVPLLWVIPLALYLLTFVIAFSKRPMLKSSILGSAQLAILFGAFVLLPVIASPVIKILINLMLFFVMALVCHVELVRLRPGVGRLTEFYLFIAIGGAMGGVFNTILAPLVFNGIYEYGLALVIACLLRPGNLNIDPGEKVKDYVVPLGVLAIILVPYYLFDVNPRNSYPLAFFIYQLVLAAMVYSFRRSSIRFSLAVGAVLLGMVQLSSQSNLLAHERSFFGVYRVGSAESGNVHYLLHGTTLHGKQLRNEAGRRQPQGYYAPSGPLGQYFSALAANNRGISNIGLVGLGAGATLCYMTPEQSWTVYEIDPTVVRIAKDQRLFTYWYDCVDQKSTSLIYGDARLSLEKEPNGKFDLLILDAYSSDAIPVHLLTRQSLQLYRSKLSPGGFLLFHLTNRNLDLTKVLAALLADAKLEGRIQDSEGSMWVVVALDRDDLEMFSQDQRWYSLPEASASKVWTDDFSNILSTFK